MRSVLPAPCRRVLRRLVDRRFNRLDVDAEEVGSTGGKWWCLPAALGPAPEVLSGGVGKDVSFEMELARRFGARVAMFDPSPTGQATVARMGDLPVGVRFFGLGLSGTSGPASFDPPADRAEGSYRLALSTTGALAFSCMDPADAVRLAEFRQPSLVKLDIEGFEYRFLDRMLAQGIRPGQLAVEFHHFLPGFRRSSTVSAIRNLRAAGYVPVRKRGSEWLFVLERFLPPRRVAV